MERDRGREGGRGGGRDNERGRVIWRLSRKVIAGGGKKRGRGGDEL